LYEEEYEKVKKLLAPIADYLADSELDEDVRSGIACFCILELIRTFSITMQLGILERAKAFLKEEPVNVNTDYLV